MNNFNGITINGKSPETFPSVDVLSNFPEDVAYETLFFDADGDELDGKK